MSRFGPRDSIPRRVGRPKGGLARDFPERLCQRVPFLAGAGRFCRKRLCQALEMPSEPENTQKPRKSRYLGTHPLPMSRFGPPDSIRRRVGRPLLEGWPGPRLVGRMPFLHETLLPGSRNALETTDHAETQKIAISRPCPGDPRDEPFSATRQHSTTRGEALFGRSQRVPFLARGRPFCYEALLPGKCPRDHRSRRNPEKSRFRRLVLGTPSQ